jgi:GNAT superfamily N-acetyltransferase
VRLRTLLTSDVEDLAGAFAAANWPGKTADLYTGYLADQAAGGRVVLVAEVDRRAAGYLCVVWLSGYAPFRDAHTPEIVDFNVLPARRRQGLGTALMGAAESLIASRATVAGIGVGLSAEYAPALLLYLKRGYLPDGHGIAYGGQTVPVGGTLRLDDLATLMLTKRLR